MPGTASLALVVLVLVFVAGCSRTPAAGEEPVEPLESAETPEPTQPPEVTQPVEPVVVSPIFGTADTVCESVRLFNEDDDQAKANRATDCLLAEIAAGRPVTVDIAAVTVEGDPIYMRYAFDGETTLIVEDSRADTFGSGSVSARRCNEMQGTPWFPEGIDCRDDDHTGFPEAEG